MSRKMKNSINSSRLILTISFVLFAICSIAQLKDSTTLVVKKTKDFTISGNGNAAEWNATAYLELPKRKSGSMDYQTKMKILYSETGIYCLYQCEDKIITSTIKADFEDIYNEDVVEAFFWTEESSVIYFEYELSPYNYELPILVPNYNGKFLGWRPWHYEGSKKT
ncbi:MAG: carbohydrate-binding family 9-like protein, partial [Chitinophagaceae bacterium]